MTKMTVALVIVLGVVGCKKKSSDKAETPATPTASGSAMGSAAGSGSSVAEPAVSPGAKALALDTPMDAGNGVTLTFTRKETAKGGDNQPPTYQHTVTAKCGGKDVVVIDRSDEGGDGTVSVEQPAGKAIVIMNVHIAREGEVADETEAAILELASCAVTKR